MWQEFVSGSFTEEEECGSQMANRKVLLGAHTIPFCRTNPNNVDRSDIYIYIYIFYQKFGDAHEPRAKLEPVLAAAVCAVEADYTMWQTAPVLRKIKI